MWWGFSNAHQDINVFNLATEGATPVRKIADYVCESLGITNTPYEFTGGKNGWIGDVPQVKLDNKKINALGWIAKHSSDEAIRQAIQDLIPQIFQH
jgi:UDP-glucose 4-epimerase